MRSFRVTNENVWDNKSLGDEYVAIWKEVMRKITKEGHSEIKDSRYDLYVIETGKRLRNTTDAGRLGPYNHTVYGPFDLVKHYEKTGEMPPAGSVYARGKILSQDILREVKTILTNTRGDATDIFEHECRKFFKIPPRTI